MMKEKTTYDTSRKKRKGKWNTLFARMKDENFFLKHHVKIVNRSIRGHKVKHVLYKKIPGNWTLKGGQLVRKVILYAVKY